MLNKINIKKLDGKIINPKENNPFMELKFYYNEEYTYSFLVKGIPIDVNNLNMVYITKGRNKDFCFPIYKNKIVLKGDETKEILDIITVIYSKILNHEN